jgi:pimeloyl-ACP methyl ester carboxylesterase
MSHDLNACPGDLAIEPHKLETTTGELVECERGKLTVNEGREQTSNRLINLHFVRLKAKRSTSVNPVVFLAGGPGDSGIHWAKYPQFLKAFERIQEVADVILLDQRGCGTSEADLKMGLPQLDEDCMLSREAMLQTLLTQGKTHVAQFQDKGIDLQAYNPVDSSDDLATLRDSLGVRKLNLIGYSYGSHLSLTTIRRQESILDRVILCGFEGPDDTLKLPSNVQKQLVKLDQIWEPPTGQSRLLEMMAKVHLSLEQKPITLEIEIPKTEKRQKVVVGLFGLQALASSWMGVSNRFHSLPRLYASILRGETDDLKTAVERFIRGWARPATFYLTDGASLATPERLERIKSEAPGCLLSDSVNFPFPEINAAYDPKDLGADFRDRVHSEIPLLSITGTLDGNTPTEQALDQLTGFPNGIHHLIENAAHNDMLIPSEVHEAIVEFLSIGETKRVKSSMPKPKFKPID